MPEVNQLFFQHKEIVELLIKKADIHDGKWVLAVNLGFSAGNFGPTLEQVVPGAIVSVLGIGLARAAQEFTSGATNRRICGQSSCTEAPQETLRAAPRPQEEGRGPGLTTS